MLVYYFIPFIVGNRYLIFWVSNGHNSVTVQNRTHVYMNFFHHKDLGNHLLQLCPKVVKHPVCTVRRELDFFQVVCRRGQLLLILPETCWVDLIDQKIIVASSWFICITLPNWWCTVKQKSSLHILCSISYFFLNLAVYEIMWKKIP